MSTAKQARASSPRERWDKVEQAWRFDVLRRRLGTAEALRTLAGDEREPSIAARIRSLPTATRDPHGFFAFAFDRTRLGASFDSQSGDAVSDKLRALAVDVGEVWDWYGKRCEQEGDSRQVAVFGPATRLAYSLADELTGKWPPTTRLDVPVTMRAAQDAIRALAQRLLGSESVNAPPPPACGAATTESAGPPARRRRSGPKATAGEAQERILGWLMGGDDDAEQSRRLGAKQAEIARATGLAPSTVSKYLAQSRSTALQRLQASRKNLARGHVAGDATDPEDDPSNIAARREQNRRSNG